MVMKLALVGFGTVGQGLAQILRDQADSLAHTQGFEAQIVAVVTPRRGALVNPNGLNLTALLEHAADFAAYPDEAGLLRGWTLEQIIRESNADVVIEVSPSNLETAQPATDYLRAAFNSGKHVVTANKGPAALFYGELVALAKSQGRFFGIEGTVMSGTPALRLALEDLAGAKITEIRGILNGTTNYMLSQMEAGASYPEALAEAQRLGYAETDPTADVEGHDAAGKVQILANAVMGASLTAADIPREGISQLTPEAVQAALSAGEHYKLIGRVWHEGDQRRAAVELMRLPAAHPLAGVKGATNAITYTTELLGPITLVGAGAGAIATGFALLSDLLTLHRQQAG